MRPHTHSFTCSPRALRFRDRAALPRRATKASPSPSWAAPPRLAFASLLLLGLLHPFLFAQTPTAPPGGGAPEEPSRADETLPASEATSARVASAARETTGTVVHTRLESIIHRFAEDWIVDAIAQARAEEAQVLVIELDTPGGILDSTRRIWTAMLAADVPVVVFVAPQGAQAASAGFFLLMAADLAAMAPSTNTGAAHPVAAGGQTIEGVMGEKVEQDSAAAIRALAARRGRPTDLAQAAVIESKSYTASEALESGLIDVVAEDLGTLLGAIDGRTITKNGVDHVLATAQAEVRTLEMTTFQRLRSVIANPNLALALVALGALGLWVEVSSPGLIFPGVVGAICLILGAYGISVLPVNWAGIALLILAAILFVLEIKVTSFGVLGLGGVAALVLGAILLFDSPDPAVRVSTEVVVAIAVVASGVMAFLITVVARVHRRRASTGQEGMVDELGFARSDLAPRGKVTVRGEIWDAVSEAPIAAGEPVVVTGVDGLLLRVAPAVQPAPPDRERRGLPSSVRPS